jgi:signal transduction histidine kinase
MCPVEISLDTINSAGEELKMVTVVDVTARKVAAERLAATTVERDDLRRRFIQAQEQERLRLARELHDQTGQQLTGVILQIKNVENSVREVERTELREVRRNLEKVGQVLHHVAWELRPASIDELGLADALANYIAEWAQQYKIEGDFHCNALDLGEISEEVGTAIYRVVQEALNNVVKHAQNATSVSVVIERSDRRLRLTIEDDGCGFDADSLRVLTKNRSSGLGLAGIRERLTLIGAELEIESSIGIGTTIFARIPVEKLEAA